MNYVTGDLVGLPIESYVRLNQATRLFLRGSGQVYSTVCSRNQRSSHSSFAYYNSSTRKTSLLKFAPSLLNSFNWS